MCAVPCLLAVFHLQLAGSLVWAFYPPTCASELSTSFVCMYCILLWGGGGGHKLDIYAKTFLFFFIFTFMPICFLTFYSHIIFYFSSVHHLSTVYNIILLTSFTVFPPTMSLDGSLGHQFDKRLESFAHINI
jgi:hypothetical protein